MYTKELLYTEVAPLKAGASARRHGVWNASNCPKTRKPYSHNQEGPKSDPSVLVPRLRSSCH